MALKKLIDLSLLTSFKGELDKLFGKKADTIYVDAELLKKANSTDLDNAKTQIAKDIEAAKTEANSYTDAQVSTAKTELTTEINKKANTADLMEGNFIKSSILPSFVDDVVEADTKTALPETGEAGKIYVTKDDNKTYRWGGTEYVEISSSLALGETAGTAYEGSKGKAVADKVATLEGTTIPGINTKLEAVETQAGANKTAIETLNGTGAGSVSKAVSDAVTPVSTKADANEANITKITNGTTVVPKASHAVNADNATTANKVANGLTIAGSTFDGSTAVTVALNHTHITDFNASVVAVDLSSNTAVQKVANDLAEHITNVESGASVAVDGTTIEYINGQDAQHKKLAVKAVPMDKVTGLQGELNNKLNSADIALATTQEVLALFTA